MRLLLKAALLNRKHLVLLLITVSAMFMLTIASQMEMLSLGVIAKTGPDAFVLFGPKDGTQVHELSLEDVEEKWGEITHHPDGLMTREDANKYVVSKQGASLIQKITYFLDKHFQISTNLIRLAAVLVIVAFFKAIALFVHRYTTQVVAIRVSRDLRLKYFEHMQSLPMSFYQRHNIGELSARATGDAGTVAGAINSMLINYLQTPFALLTTLAALLFISWKLTLVLFVGFPVILAPIIFIAKKIKLISKQMQRNQEGFASVLIDFLAGIQTIKVFAMEEFSYKKYRAQNHLMSKLEERSARFGLASRPILHSISSLFFAAVILAGLYLFRLGPAELLVFCGLLYVFYEPIKKIAEESNQILRGIAAAERMYEVLDLQSSIVDAPDAADLTGFKETIEFRNVSFCYEQDWVLRDLSFTVRKGETVAIAGPTGAGKSTIVQLLPRLYDVQKGEILIDGKPLRRYTQKSLREHISFVPQKPFLFLDTVRENISFGRPFSHEEIVSAARKAHAEEFIVGLPNSYDSLLAEAGKNLSGGQQQRLAIARALVKKAPILVMDEATSSLDAISEGKIKDAIIGLHGQVTQIIIAHRFSTIEHADRIIYIEQGRKIAEGTKAHLLEICPNFRRMWEMMYNLEKAENAKESLR